MGATIITTVEVAFDGSTLTDISTYIESVSINYGRARLLDEFSAGRAVCRVSNRTNVITPGHSDSLYGNTQLIGREVRISTSVTGGSDSHSTYLFRGTITDVDYFAEFDTSTVTLTLTDGFDRLSRTEVLDEDFIEQDCGARVSAILDLSSVNYPSSSDPEDRSIATGSVTTPVITGVTNNALDLIQQITRTENGRFMCNHAGTPSATNFGNVLTFYGQNTGTVDRGISFSDAKTLPTGGTQMTALTLQFGSELLFNAYQFTDASGTVHTGTDSASITKYGERTIKRTLLADGTTTNNAGVYYIGLFAEPRLRISTVTTDIDAMSTSDAEKVLHINVQSAVTLSYLPPGSSSTLTAEYVIEGVSLDIRPKDMTSNASRIIATYSTSSADTTGYWLLGDPVLSVFPTILAPG